MNITEKAAIVLQEIDAALVLAEKDTPDVRKIMYQRTIGLTLEESDKLRAWIDATLHEAFIAASRTLLPTSLRCLKTAIEGLLNVACVCVGHPHFHAESALIALCDQWLQGREETK